MGKNNKKHPGARVQSLVARLLGVMQGARMSEYGNARDKAEAIAFRGRVLHPDTRRALEEVDARQRRLNELQTVLRGSIWGFFRARRKYRAELDKAKQSDENE